MNVKYIGSWADYSGYGEANRNIIHALYLAGINISTERMEFVNDRPVYGEGYQIALHQENAPLSYDIKIIHLTPNLYIKYLEPLKYHIGHLFWETDRIPASWVWNCNRMDEIWTGSEHNRQALIKSGVKVPISIFPQPINPRVPNVEPFKLRDFDGFLFYNIFEFIERKNPKALLTAYWQEFEGEENVGLLLKTFRYNFTKEAKAYIESNIKKWKQELKLAYYPRVFLYEDLLSDLEIHRLHLTGSCFVSTHRGEGWGRPQMEAMRAGNPIISTNCGGIHEYLDEKLAYLCKWKTTPVVADPMSENYQDSQMWAEIDIQDLRDKMRFAFKNQEKARIMGMNAQKHIAENFNLLKVGQLMKKRLEEITL